MTHEPSLADDEWRALSPARREEAARALVSVLPGGFSFKGVRPYVCGRIARAVAQYDFEGSTFSLVPSVEASLGYDAGREWEPDDVELESWRETAEEYELTESIRGALETYTHRPRRVTLRAYLIETEATELGWSACSADDPDVAEDIALFGGGVMTRYRGGAVVRVRRTEAGAVIAERAREVTHAEISAGLAERGFRLPTADEWEHACGAGAATVFRWGDHAPCDRYPTDARPGRGAASGFASDWDDHRRPNAFGLQIAFDPYRLELTADPARVCGGDGGVSTCGGAGFFIGWLALATAFFHQDFCTREPGGPIEPGFTFGRRVLPLH